MGKYELCANTSATGEFALSTNLTIPGTSSTISPKQKRHQFQGGKVKGESKEKNHHEISVQEMGERVREGESAREEDVRMLGGGLSLCAGKDCEAVRGVGQEGIGYGGKAGEGREEGEWVIGTSKERLASVAEGNKIGDKRGLSGAGIGGGKKQRLSTLKTVEEEEEEDEEDDDEDGGGKSDKGKAIAQALDRMSVTALSIQRTKTEEAVEKLQKEYESLLSTKELVKAFCLMENVVKASVFVSLQPGTARDMWLQNELSKL
ncbi:hypothetical protein L873DRAFT_1840960 [Choiromyces venosus 120613-1]|uniref:Uncharacterized protein n=1 Tax=Choiromyces venosus 120613-1 TaxID=1336337 RepID=A0A3N4JZN3_9PEZI|nr:hypothetical protein L873DRAFT_1840960 [Choiromyces venosus 120613-1]